MRPPGIRGRRRFTALADQLSGQTALVTCQSQADGHAVVLAWQLTLWIRAYRRVGVEGAPEPNRWQLESLRRLCLTQIAARAMDIRLVVPQGRRPGQQKIASISRIRRLRSSGFRAAMEL